MTWSGIHGQAYADNLIEVRAYNWNINNNSMFLNYDIYLKHNNQINYTPLNLTHFKGN